jgi:hypothetical protein
VDYPTTFARRSSGWGFAILLFVGCTSTAPGGAPPPPEGSSAEARRTAQAPTTQPAASSQPTAEAASAARDPAARAADAQARLSTSEAGRLILAAIDAHGGLATYYERGDLTFRFRYAPVEGRPATDTLQRIDTWSSRAVHQLNDAPDTRFGWTGEAAWVHPPDATLPTNPRFWALTPYYFVGVPFVFADPGVALALDTPETFEGRTFARVRVTFAEGVGDAPDDYYVVLIDPETHRVGGVRYIVTYAGFFPDGGHSPEKLMTYDGSQVVDGITLPQTFRTFALGDDGSPQAIVTHSTLSDVSFAPHDPAAFAPPEGARVITDYGP